MNCEKCNERLSEFADNELTSMIADEMHVHLDACDRCAEEYRVLRRLSMIVASSPKPQGRGPSWEDIAARLDDHSTLPTLLDQHPKRNRWARIAIVLSLAAALLIALGLQFGLQPKTRPVNQASVVAIDLQSVIEMFANSPEAAVDSLVSKYAGASTHQHSSNLEFKPLVSTSLPSGVQLVSTRVVPMPFCHCPDGQCRCSPGECDCVACICERPDGSRFLIVENCTSYDVTFGDLESEFVQRAGQSYEQIRSNDLLAVSWAVNDRRLTAIGLTGEVEAASLLAASFK